MRTSFVVLAIIFGCALTQATTKNYCNPSGTFCAMCVTSAGGQSCTVCGKMGFSTAVKDLTGTNECTASTATNCMASNPLGADKCGMCKSGFALDSATFTCAAETTFKLPTNCAALIKTGTTVTCQGCNSGFALSKDKLTCTAAITTVNCLTAIIGADDKEVCGACKSGFAFKGALGTDCATAVPAAVVGCARLADDGTTCMNQCNSAAGFWMSDVNKCTAFASIATAAFALIASFFFSN